MHETTITLQGNVGGDVRLRTAGDSQVASFRIGCTPRRWSRRDQAWVDAGTQWYSVSCWRTLAQHVEQSVRRGDPVVVHGRLTTSTWTNQEGVEVTTYEVEATFVGHDLNRGTTTFTRPARSAVPTTADEATAPVPAASTAAA